MPDEEEHDMEDFGDDDWDHEPSDEEMALDKATEALVKAYLEKKKMKMVPVTYENKPKTLGLSVSYIQMIKGLKENEGVYTERYDLGSGETRGGSWSIDFTQEMIGHVQLQAIRFDVLWE